MFGNAKVQRPLRPEVVPTQTRVDDTPPPSLSPEELLHWLERVRQVPAVRGRLIRRIRKEIAEGRYESPAKVRKAVDRMLDELAGR